MDLNAITNPKASGKTLLFKNTRPVAEAVAKGLQAAIPVKPVAPTGGSIEGVLSVVRAMNDGLAQLAASIRGPAQKSAPATPSAAASAASTAGLNTMLGSDAKRHHVAKLAEAAAREPAPTLPASVEAQRRREAEAREVARKAAAQADAERVLVTKGGGCVRVLKELDRSLSDAALLVLSHIITRFEANDRRPVKVNAPDLAQALDLPLATAQAAYTELVDKHLLISAANSLGVVQVQPGIGVTGA